MTSHERPRGKDATWSGVVEGRRVAAAMARDEAPARFFGGVGVALRCPSALAPPLAREYSDIDLAARARDRKIVTPWLEGLGYAADTRFNALHGEHRLLFWDERSGRQLDVFLDEARLCHHIDLRGRFDDRGPSLPLADLLLLKLQVVHTTEKDFLDMVALLADHRLTDGPSDDGIDAGYLVGLMTNDWGLWRTTDEVAKRLIVFVQERLPDLESAPRVIERANELIGRVAEAPKSRRWRARARLGERKRWYELPEEHH